MSNDLLRNDSTNVEAIHIRGLCLYYEDNLDKALSHFQQVLKLAPDFAKAKEAFKVSCFHVIYQIKKLKIGPFKTQKLCNTFQ